MARSRHPFRLPIYFNGRTRSVTTSLECPYSGAAATKLLGVTTFEVLTSKKFRGTTMEPIVKRLGIDVNVEKPSMLRQWSAHRISEMIQSSNSGLSIMKRRGYVHTNGIDGPSAKRPSLGVIRHVGSALRTAPPVRSSVINHGPVKNGRSKVPGVRGGYKMHMISWIDAPDDVFFIATDATRKLRHQVAHRSVKRAARNPWRGLLLHLPMPTIEIARADLREEVVMLD